MMPFSLLRKMLAASPLAVAFLFFGFAKEAEAPAHAFAEGKDGSAVNSPCVMHNTTFAGGEELTYKLYWNWNFIWYSAGEMTFRVHDADDQWHYSVLGTTYPAHDWFFKVRDQYDTWVQKDTGLPIMGIRDILEGKYRLYDYLTYDQSRRTVFNERGKAKDDIRERKRFNIDACMHDIVSILYHSRNVDFSRFQTNDYFNVKIFMDKEAWPLKVRYKGRVPGKEVYGLGKFNTVQFSPEVIPGRVFPEGATINVWATDDANRLPLVIESPLAVGTVKAVLHKHQGLRWPVKAKL
jgi:hypothetical protein